MNYKIIDHHDETLKSFLVDKIAEFNWQRWEVSERLPLAVKLENEHGDVVAGCYGRTFGNWLMIDTLWVSDDMRGQGIGDKLLNTMEEKARQRGCNRCLLDTLNFQAKPFYESRGYYVEWKQENYPLTGSRYYMTKRLD